MNTRYKSWIFFGAIVYCGLMVLAAEHVLKSDSFYGISLIVIGVIGWAIAEIRVEMQRLNQ